MTGTVQPSAPLELTQIFEPIRDDLDAVEREFARHIESRVQLIPEIGRYIQNSGGKRVRPALLLMAARLGGYRGDRAILDAQCELPDPYAQERIHREYIAHTPA